MKEILTILLLSVFTLTYSHSACFDTGALDSLDPNYAGYYKTYEREYTVNTCKKGYRKLKKSMIKEARNFCKTNHNSPSLDPLKCKHFYKEKCIKKKRPGHVTKVTVTGKFSAKCR